MQEKVELAGAMGSQRGQIGSRGFQQSKALERLARLLDQLGQACCEFTQIEGLKGTPEKQFESDAKLIRRIRKSLALVMINPADANTRQGLKLGRRASKLTVGLQEKSSQKDSASAPDNPLTQVVHFQIGRMIHLLAEIADALLAANFGPAVRLQNYKQLKNAAHAFTTDNATFGVERLALTRSGSTIAALKAEYGTSSEVMAVYKEGQAHKVLEEISGVDQWKKVYPKVAPSVISHHVEHEDEMGSMVIEHLPGRTLESLLLNSQWDSASLLLARLNKTLRKIWKSSWTRERAEPGYMRQLSQRMPETRQTHPTLFNDEQTLCGLTRPDFTQLIDQVESLEKQVAPPFCVLIHGDFNVDNLLYDELQDRIYFIDLHRASYSDYVQDISVLMVSIYRLPIMDSNARAEMMSLIKQLYQFARRFAKANEDRFFDVRLAIALARSFATSTRFIYDKGFAKKLAFRAAYLLEAVTLLNSEKLERYKLPLEEIFSD
ncbi:MULTISPECIES: phosphotransferase family protein [unclassified Marinobacter]|uniref:phosphotransferase family protein n=1 Tax=unclassified Marinobacter TaxID=83889 RepID=UPI0026E28890|nr:MULTISPECIES: aminoglycoside phosphotransferase family protein [unclassified Marinobacter]MDO6443393.1 aminoglycoside phosphotransferase family protein [Marinobacter sp. 2_MG-2023]MDO6824209.1 aminoglycoside phosphotransferase family protein [Marinobacter sp. 1_MG-2023]